ncbi:sucrase ferredoxin [Nocardioides cavernaquae]|uniref:Sucrase ferredoxin n=1 Tax=Nocardioides cavernaquae TaxID=2321396 RepID=A0A3A5H456_9ACTN|nr:sucrase ferredoxin [Nocardioides cavernaquae]RJS45526.1 sucrase ferredoxin [Nocardioides cavernaquae]
MTSYRCSVAAAEQPMAGTAAHDRGFLLIEHPGPWGRKALAESRWLPDDVRTTLAARAEDAGVRVQLIRRPGATPRGDGFRVFLANTSPGARWLAATVLEDPAELLTLALGTLDAGAPEGFALEDGPLFLVCTNGRRDVCCAERGRPIAAALASAYPAETWETTHLGGHRFAGALLTLPAGLSYGRVDPDSAVEIARASASGHVVAPYLRGRTAYDGAVQAAEVELLDRLGLTAIDALALVASEVVGAHTIVTFRHAGGEASVRVTAIDEPPMRQSCADEVEKPSTAWRVD